MLRKVTSNCIVLRGQISANDLLFLQCKQQFSHVPVMAKEIVDVLNPQDGKVFIDMTFGAGGHTKSLLDTNKSIKIIAIDRDPVAVKKAQELAAQVAIKSERLGIKQTVIPIHGRFSQSINQIHLHGIPYNSVNGVLFDLGASSMQYDNSERGFSISSTGPLDMRMDTTNSSDITAEDVINNLDQEHLAKIFKILGEERKHKKFANAIMDARALLGRIRTTSELARVIQSTSSGNIDSLGRYSHPGTRVFQALRIFVNNELNELNYALPKIREYLIPTQIVDKTDAQKSFGNSKINPSDVKLNKEDLRTEVKDMSIPSNKFDRYDYVSEASDSEGGTSVVKLGLDYKNLPDVCGIAAVLTFHSLEDRIVKRHFSGIDVNEPVIKHLIQHDRIRTTFTPTKKEFDLKLNGNKKWLPLLKHVMKPTDEEVAANPRSRSAKLRIALRVD